jgi:hypothetical protein
VWLPFIEQVLAIDLSEDNGDRQFADTVTSVMLLGGSDVDRRQFLAASAAVGLAALDLTDAEAVTRRVNRPGPINVGMGEVAAVRDGGVHDGWWPC